jgi:hypothetical protein
MPFLCRRIVALPQILSVVGRPSRFFIADAYRIGWAAPSAGCRPWGRQLLPLSASRLAPCLLLIPK